MLKSENKFLLLKVILTKATKFTNYSRCYDLSNDELSWYNREKIHEVLKNTIITKNLLFIEIYIFQLNVLGLISLLFH